MRKILIAHDWDSGYHVVKRDYEFKWYTSDKGKDDAWYVDYWRGQFLALVEVICDRLLTFATNLCLAQDTRPKQESEEVTQNEESPN